MVIHSRYLDELTKEELRLMVGDCFIWPYLIQRYQFSDGMMVHLCKYVDEVTLCKSQKISYDGYIRLLKTSYCSWYIHGPVGNSYRVDYEEYQSFVGEKERW